MSPPHLAILDATSLAAQRVAAATGPMRVQIAPTFTDAVTMADELAERGYPELHVDGPLLQQLDRPVHVALGTRADLGPHEVLACMQAEGRVRRVICRDEAHLPQVLEQEGTTAILVVEGLDRVGLEQLLVRVDLHDSHRWRCRDAVDARVAGGTLCSMACAERSIDGGDGPAVMFHASPEPLGSSGRTLAIAPTRPLWASPSAAFAACFGVDAIRRGALTHGFDALAPLGRVTVGLDDERDALALSGEYYLHELRVPRGGRRPAGGCRGHEYLVQGDIELLEVSGSLRTDRLPHDFGILVEQASPADPDLRALMARVPEGRVRSVFDMPSALMETLPSLRRQLAVWLPDELDTRPSGIPHFEPPAALRLLRRCILPEIAGRVRFAESPAHGFEHAWVVAHLALLIAMLEDQPPIAPMVAAVLHDSGRHDDGDDVHHPQVGARIASDVVPSLGSAGLSARRCAAVADAIASHSAASLPPHSVAAILRDADRLGLAWQRGPRPALFATEWGLKLAHAGPRAAELSFRRIFGVPLWDTAGLCT
jgi:hypothetical protein